MYETLNIFTIISDYVKEIPFIEETDEENAILVINFTIRMMKLKFYPFRNLIQLNIIRILNFSLKP